MRLNKENINKLDVIKWLIAVQTTTKIKLYTIKFVFE